MNMWLPPTHRLASPLVASVAICISACVHIEHPPASWGDPTPQTLNDNCASFSASYSNKGNSSDGAVGTLSTWLFPRSSTTRGIDKDLFGAQTVTLEFEGALLTVKTFGAMGAYHQWSFDKSKHEFACLNGVLRISQGGDKSGQNIAAVGTDAIDLYRTPGDLIVNRHGGSAGVALMIPIADYNSIWARFPVQATSATQTEPAH